MLRRASLVFLVFASGACASEPLNPLPSQEEPGLANAGRGASPIEGDFRPIAAYPAGPYGHGLGSVIEDLTFLGWRDPVAAGYDEQRLEAVSFADFYDPNGSDTELIVVNASAVWCPVCRLEMSEIDELDLANSYRARKVVLVGTLFDNAQSGPAAPADLALWGHQLGWSVDFPLLLDPGLKLGTYFSSDATPLNLVIDAREMRILQAYMGYGTGLWAFVDRVLDERGVSPRAP